jgi:formate dehydrogenase subunit gamma
MRHGSHPVNASEQSVFHRLGRRPWWCIMVKMPPKAWQEEYLADYEPWNADRAGAIIAARVREPGAMLPILHDLQATFGCVPTEAVPLVAQALNVTRAEVHGVVTFYHEYRRHKPGRHILRLCRAEACQALGCEALADHVRSRLNIGWHGTTSDGAVTLEPVFCLGLCAIGPAALLDDQPLARLDPARLEAVLESLP